MSKRITFQKIFDKAWQAFIVEDKPPAMNENGRCFYEDDFGNCCAVGLALPEGHESRKYIGSFGNLMHKYPELFAQEILDTPGDTLVGFQQRLHDHLAVKGSWFYSKEYRKQKYIELAEAFHLKVPGENNDK